MLTANTKPHSHDDRPNTKPHSPDRKLPPHVLMHLLRRHPLLPLPLELKLASWTSLPTTTSCHQKNELVEWLTAAASAVQGLAI